MIHPSPQTEEELKNHKKTLLREAQERCRARRKDGSRMATVPHRPHANEDPDVSRARKKEANARYYRNRKRKMVTDSFILSYFRVQLTNYA